MRIKYTFLLIFFLLIPIAIASSKIEVLYFYSSTCPISNQIEPFKNNVKSYWKDRVNWTDYDFMEEENKEIFVKYRIANVPVALISCFNRIYRIERNEIKEKLNETIAECYRELPIRFPKTLSFLLALSYVIFIFPKKFKKRARRK